MRAANACCIKLNIQPPKVHSATRHNRSKWIKDRYSSLLAEVTRFKFRYSGNIKPCPVAISVRPSNRMLEGIRIPRPSRWSAFMICSGYRFEMARVLPFTARFFSFFRREGLLLLWPDMDFITCGLRQRITDRKI